MAKKKRIPDRGKGDTPSKAYLEAKYDRVVVQIPKGYAAKLDSLLPEGGSRSRWVAERIDECLARRK